MIGYRTLTRATIFGQEQSATDARDVSSDPCTFVEVREFRLITWDLGIVLGDLGGQRDDRPLLDRLIIERSLLSVEWPIHELDQHRILHLSDATDAR